jgi:putative tryptophan/tyrosine transport system substrate-binding protein
LPKRISSFVRSGMRRRDFLAALLATAPAARMAGAQNAPSATRKIGVVTLGVPESAPIFLAFITGLRELGYEPGKNIILEFRHAEGRADRLPRLIAQLFAEKVDVLVVESIAAATAAKNASQTTPIVLAIASDPVGAGIFASLTHPGGNVTGLSLQSEEITAKRVQLLRELLPTMSKLAVLYNPNRPTIGTNIKETETAARGFGMDVRLIPLDSPDNLSIAFDQVPSAHTDALMTLPDGMLLSLARPIGEATLRNRLPSIFPERDFVESGGLMAYGPSLAAHFHRAATYVDKILKGAKPGDLPVEQPTKFELTVSLQSAKTLGLTIPPTIMALADQVIE